MALIKAHRRGLGGSRSPWPGYLALLAVAEPSRASPTSFDQALQRLLLFALVGRPSWPCSAARRALVAVLPSACAAPLREGRYPVLHRPGAVRGRARERSCGSAASGEAVPPLGPPGPPDLAGVALLCLSVGLYEEALFRVLLLGGLLSGRGAARNGVVTAVLVSSVAFGAAHVALEGEARPPGPCPDAAQDRAGPRCNRPGARRPSTCARAASSAWWRSMPLADFFPMALLAVLGEPRRLARRLRERGRGRARRAPGPLHSSSVYLVLVALYAPAAVHAWRLLEATPLPASGPFEQGWDPRPDDDPTLAPPSDDDRPPRHERACERSSRPPALLVRSRKCRPCHGGF